MTVNAATTLAAPAEQDRYLEFQLLSSRSGAVATETIFRVYWSQIGMRVETKADSASILLPGKKERYSVDLDRKLARKLPYEGRPQPQQMITSEWKVTGSKKNQELGAWQCTAFDLHNEVPEQFKRHLPSDAKAWSAHNLELDTQRLYDQLGRSQPNLRLLGDLFKALPEGSGPIVRAQLIRDRQQAIWTTINLVSSRTVPHDPIRYEVPKDFEILDVSEPKLKATPPKLPSPPGR
ncbi:MAG TPA: hypothetical protein VGB99_06770 [Acidobacteriota bacterium]